MASKLLDTYKTQVKEVALVPSVGGAFEVVVGDDTIYSKLQTGTFPSEGAVVSEVAAKL